MKLKTAILKAMDRDTLKDVVEAMEMEDVDRRSAEAMRTKFPRSRRATANVLITHLKERQVKAVCEQMGISPKGRRWLLTEQFLDQDSVATNKSAKPSTSRQSKVPKQN